MCRSRVRCERTTPALETVTTRRDSGAAPLAAVVVQSRPNVSGRMTDNCAACDSGMEAYRSYCFACRLRRVVNRASTTTYAMLRRFTAPRAEQVDVAVDQPLASRAASGPAQSVWRRGTSRARSTDRRQSRGVIRPTFGRRRRVPRRKAFVVPALVVCNVSDRRGRRLHLRLAYSAPRWACARCARSRLIRGGRWQTLVPRESTTS